MSSVVIAGDTSGSVTLAAPAVAGTTTLTLPATSGTVLTSGTAVTAAQGGTGLTSVGTSGNVLTSNGTAWVSQALPAGGVTSLNGETGAIVNTDAQDIGSYVWAVKTGGITFGSTYAGSSLSAAGHTTGSLSAGGYVQYAAGTTLSGTWRAMGSVTNQNTYQLSLFVRVS